MSRSTRARRAGLAALLLASACVAPDDREEEARRLTGGDPAAGRVLVGAYGCGACHTIASVPGARGLVGPRLDGIRERAYVAGVLTNGPANLVRWIRDPKGVDSLTAMPTLGLTQAQARDVASFLYSLDPRP